MYLDKGCGVTESSWLDVGEPTYDGVTCSSDLVSTVRVSTF